MNKGIAIGGPMDGKELSAETWKLTIPVEAGVNSAGEPLFGATLYHWNGFNWIYGEAVKH